MLTILRSPDGHIEAACEWWLTDDQGLMDWTQGRWVRVEQLEISHGQEQSGLLSRLIRQIATQAPKAIGAFWQRQGKTAHQLHWYSRQRLLQHDSFFDEEVMV